MLKQIVVSSLSLLFVLNCADSQKHTENNQSTIQTNTFTPLSVYNQAYQENFSEDSIHDIISNAHNAYVLVDPFDDETVVNNIANIKAKHNEVSGYISVGTGENYRTDFTTLKPYLTSTSWSNWPDEFFVSDTVGALTIMKERINKMASWGLNWVEFDNMDWLDEESRDKYGLSVTVPQAKAYINALCTHTRSKGMKCMAKNTVEGFESFDGVLYESFSNEKNWWDNEGTKAFLNAGKLVIINHYNESDCDGVYAYYKSFYGSDKISFICEDRNLKKYKHYNQN